MDIDKEGWCLQATRLASPNQNDRPDNQGIDLLVIHNISLPPGQFGGHCIADLFLNRLDCNAHPFFDQLRALKVSSHFFIRRDGSLFQFVSADKRAWHAGVSSFKGREGCNDFSVGVELEGTDFVSFEPEQYETLVSLTDALRRRYSLKTITGHHHIAPVRKTDPGPFFDWQLYKKMLGETSTSETGNALPDFWIE